MGKKGGGGGLAPPDCRPPNGSPYLSATPHPTPSAGRWMHGIVCVCADRCCSFRHHCRSINMLRGCNLFHHHPFCQRRRVCEFRKACSRSRSQIPTNRKFPCLSCCHHWSISMPRFHNHICRRPFHQCRRVCECRNTNSRSRSCSCSQIPTNRKCPCLS